MTQLQTSPLSQSSSAPTICYQVAMPRPQSHLFEVMLQVESWQAATLDLNLPVWTPGSYLVREYARHLQRFSATTPDGQPLAWSKQSKNHWHIATPDVSTIQVFYQVYANELTVRTNHLDVSHGYFNGAALFLYIPQHLEQPIQIKVVPPYPSWQVTTPLPAIADAPNTFLAANYDELVDSPFEIGNHQLYSFSVEGKSHELAIWGGGNLNPDRLIPDIQKIIQAESQLFGGLPYERYVFLLHLSSQGFGGLEHRTSCSLNYPRFNFRKTDRYHRFLNLVAHEFFHLWNVKRIRPKALENFDYNNENYTPSLWFCEGATSYYDTVIPLRAGIYDAQFFLEAMAQSITRFLTTPGRAVQPLSESSFDAWIKLYRPSPNSNNSQISYYLKGKLVSFLLDLLIRARHQNQRSLDDVMRRLWQAFGQPDVGFTPEQLQATIESVADTDLQDFLGAYLHGTDELPFDRYLQPFGLQVQSSSGDGEKVPYLGLVSKTENGRHLVQFVASGSPAEDGGIDAGDEVLALNGCRISAEQLPERLQDFNPGEAVQLTVFHGDRLRTCLVTLSEPKAERYKLVPVAQPSTEQVRNFQGWLGVSLADIG